MSFVIAAPEFVTAAATDLANIGSTLNAANAAAAATTTAVVAAGADEVSAAITALFDGHAQAYQELASAASQYHQQFTTLLGQAREAYVEAEQGAMQLLRDTVTRIEQPFVPLLPFAPNGHPVAPPVLTNSSVGLIIGGTGSPFAAKFLVAGSLYNLATDENYLLYTPEQAWPLLPNLGGLSLGQSFTQGAAVLDQVIQTQTAAGNHVTVWTVSQSSVVATYEIRNLIAQGSPYQDQLSFVLTGNPSNPNGGFFTRFDGLYVPLLDWNIAGTTPSNSPYQTAIYTNQYDPVADFPTYPLNLVSSANSLMGMLQGQHSYVVPRTYYELPTSPGYTGNTTYHMSLDDHLPLVEPLRHLGTPGNAVADLLQPDLRVLVDMGYGTGQYADISTPAQLFAIPNPETVLPALANGTVQGVRAFGVDLGLLPQSMFPDAYPYLAALDPALNFPTGQPSVTAISLALGAERQLMDALGLIPEWSQ